MDSAHFKNKALAFLTKLFGWFLNAYIEIFRGTPMMYNPWLFTMERLRLLVFRLTGQLQPSLSFLSIPALHEWNCPRWYLLPLIKDNSKRLPRSEWPTVKPRKVVLPRGPQHLYLRRGMNLSSILAIHLSSMLSLWWSSTSEINIATQAYHISKLTIIAVIYFNLDFYRHWTYAHRAEILTQIITQQVPTKCRRRIGTMTWNNF